MLTRHGVECRVFEAADAVGGRVRTDAVDGFLLDRGYQIVLTQLPELHLQLDWAALDLRSYDRGAVVRVHGKFHRVADPRHRPGLALASLTAPIGTFADDMRFAALIIDVLRAEPRALLRRPDTSTADALRR